MNENDLEYSQSLQSSRPYSRGKKNSLMVRTQKMFYLESAAKDNETWRTHSSLSNSVSTNWRKWLCSFVCWFICFVLGPHPVVLRGYSWFCARDHSSHTGQRTWDMIWGWLHARLYLLYYGSSIWLSSYQKKHSLPWYHLTSHLF